MSDAMIVSRMILGAQADPKLVRKVARSAHVPKGAQINFCIFQTTASRGGRAGRVLCCWSGGKLDKKNGPLMSPAGMAAADALMNLPACMDDFPGTKGRLVIRELKLGPTPLRDKVIDAVLEAQPGDRLCFLGDLAGELDGKMGLTFNIMDGDPIFLDEQGRPIE
jgi:hypothetical protein